MSMYCGTKATPKGRVKGTAGYCFIQGRRAGFVGALSKNYITKAEMLLNGANMGQRVIQGVAKALGLPKYAEKKSIILPRVLAHDWDKLNAKNVLMAM